MREGLENDINKNELQKKGQSLFAILEEKTKHLIGTPAAQAEQKMRILESMGIIVPQGERIRHYVNYILEIIEKEPEENKMAKILNILEKDKIFTKEEMEILIIGEKAIAKGEVTQDDEQKIENVMKNDRKSSQWIKKILLYAAILLAPFTNKNKDQFNKEKIQNEKNIETPAIKKPADLLKTGALPIKEIVEKIPVEVEKYIEVIKNLEFIKGNFYVLDMSDKKSPTLYQTTKEGKVMSKDTVGIGMPGHETKNGLYIVSRWLKQKDVDLYGEDGVFKLVGYHVKEKKENEDDTETENLENMGIHRIYPPEEKERAKKMLDANTEKEISYSCINVFSDYFKKHIVQDYEKQGGEGRLIIAIMQDKNNFNTKGWKEAAQKMQKDVETLEKILNE